MKACLISLCCCLCLIAKAQDTIWTVSQKTLLVRVLEISDKEVRYKNFYNPDGVIRTINNSEVLKIVYESGTEEARFKRNETGLPATSRPEKFVIEGRHLVYKNEDVTPKMAFKIMMQRDPKYNSDDLNNMLVNVQGNKTGQVAFIIAAPVCLVGAALLARNNTYGPNDYPKARKILLTGVGLSAGCFITSMIYRSIKNKHIRQAAKLYNDEL